MNRTSQISSGSGRHPKLTPAEKNGKRLKYELDLRGVTFADIARELDPPVSSNSVRLVAFNLSRSQRIRAAICRHLGMEEAAAWPDAA